jgi:hypothetical protein
MPKPKTDTPTKCTRASNRLKGLPPPELVLVPERADSKTVRQDSGDTVSRPQAENRAVRDSGFSEFATVDVELPDTVTEEENDESGTPDTFSSPLTEPPPRPKSPLVEPPPRPESPLVEPPPRPASPPRTPPPRPASPPRTPPPRPASPPRIPPPRPASPPRIPPIIIMAGARPQMKFIAPPTFHGRPDEDVLEWMTRYESVGQYNRWADADLRANFPMYLDGPARKWYRCLAVIPADWADTQPPTRGSRPRPNRRSSNAVPK